MRSYKQCAFFRTRRSIVVSTRSRSSVSDISTLLGANVATPHFRNSHIANILPLYPHNVTSESNIIQQSSKSSSSTHINHTCTRADHSLAFTLTDQHFKTNTGCSVSMAGGNKLFGEHGRTAVNGGGRGLASPNPYHNSTDGYTASYLNPRIENDGLQRRPSNREPSRSYRDDSRFVASPKTFRSRSVRKSREGALVANGHHVRVASPDDFNGRDMHAWSMDELNQEFARVCGLFPDHSSGLFTDRPFDSFSEYGRSTVPSHRTTEYRPRRSGLGSLSRPEMLRSITSARAREKEFIRRR